MSFKHCMNCMLQIFLVPVALSTYAATQTPYDNGAGIFFGHLFCYLFQFVCFLKFFENVLGARWKKNILDQYASPTSISVTGIVTKFHVTIHRTNFIETRQTHRIDYVYAVVDEENGSTAMYKKTKETTYRCSLCRDNLWKPSRTGRPEIPLKQLPLQPGSGYPAHLIEEELDGYWIRVVFVTSFGFGGGLFLPLFLSSITDDAKSTIIVGSVWAFVIGIHAARKGLQRWEKDMLIDGKVEVENVHVYEENLPEAVAVPVTAENMDEGRAPMVAAE